MAHAVCQCPIAAGIRANAAAAITLPERETEEGEARLIVHFSFVVHHRRSSRPILGCDSYPQRWICTPLDVVCGRVLL